MWSQITSNRRKSFLLAFCMLLLLASMGFAFTEIIAPGSGIGIIGAAGAVLIWGFMLLVTHFSGDKIMLSASGARRVYPDELPALYNVVEEMKIASGLPFMPEIYVIDDNTPNAFATGRSPEKCAVAVTSGLLTRLNRNELQGVIAHEIGHIMNRDVQFMTMLGIMLGVIVIMSDAFGRGRWWYFMGGRRGGRSSGGGGGGLQAAILIFSILMIILAPILANLIYFASSRKREFLADACSAQYTRYPEGLASALQKISGVPQDVKQANRVTAPMYIVNPLASGKRKITSMYATHPPTAQRINILRSMGGAPSLTEYQKAYGKSVPGRVLFSDRDILSFQGKDIPPLKPGKMDLGGAPGFAAPATTAAGAAALAQAESAAAQGSAEASTKDRQAIRLPDEPAVNRSSVNDFFWKKEGYGIIDCDCGVRLKIPPKFHSRTVHCPKCRKHYKVPSFG